jgi:hypothetical protein
MVPDLTTVLTGTDTDTGITGRIGGADITVADTTAAGTTVVDTMAADITVAGTPADIMGAATDAIDRPLGSSM